MIAELGQIEMLPIDSIEKAESNPRLAECERAEDIQAFAEELERNGQLQPIGVVKAGGGYRVVWGSRRLAAMKLGKQGQIAAVVLPDNADAATLAAAENLHRRAMNPLEEALAVDEMLKRHAALPAKEAHQKVGEALGRSSTWVRDRLFLSRLCPKARQYLVTGDMPIGIARELAKVVDPRIQERLAFDWYGCGAQPPSVLWAREQCGEYAHSLAQVPWKLDATGVAKGKPACTECEHNSENAIALGLFEHEADSPVFGGWKQESGAHCLDQRCFEAKSRAVQKATAVIIAAAAKAKKPADRQHAAEAARPNWMPLAVVDALQKSAPGGVEVPEERVSKAKLEAQRKAQEKKRKERERLQAQKEKAAKAFDKELVVQLRASPGALALIFILQDIGADESVFGGLMRGDTKRRDAARVPEELAALVKAGSEGALTFQQLDELVASAFTPNYGESMYRKLFGKLGRAGKELLARTFGDLVAASEGMPALPPAPVEKKSDVRKSRSGAR